VRNYAASLGLAILGTVLIDQFRSQVTSSLISQGLSPKAAAKAASHISESQTGHVGPIPHYIRLDFAHASQTVFYIMAAILAVAAIVARVGLQRGVQQETVASDNYVAKDTSDPDIAGQPSSS
jgi:hypothetical protein